MKVWKLLAVSALNLVLVLACVASANGQVAVGDKLNMTMNGSLGTGYTGNFGNYIGSSHALGFGVNGSLDGYYYHPQFLNFQLRPYFDRAQSNSDSQTITRSSGIAGTLSLFGGSHFPGSISYGKDFSSNSEFRIAGVPSVLGDSSGSTANIAWSALFEGYPSLNFNYMITDSSSTLLGTTSRSNNSSRNFNLNSSYEIGGFNVHGNLNHYNTEFSSPGFLTGEAFESASSGTNYLITAIRKLPLSGSLGLAWSRAGSESGGSESASSSYSATAVISPWRRFVVSESLNYTTNVIASIAQSFGQNPSANFFNSDFGSSSMYSNTQGTLTVGRGLTVSGHLNYRILHYQDRKVGDTQYGGTASFRNSSQFFGFLYLSVGIVDTATQEGNGGVGLVTNLGMMRKFGGWETSADFSYSQHTQTLLAIVTTSNYNFGGSLRRKINSSTFWSASYREARSGLTLQKGNHNNSKSFATSLSWRKYNFSANYSQSKGEAFLGSDGTLTATPLGPLIGRSFLTFDARSFGVNSSTRLFRRLMLSGGYAKVSSSSVRRTLDAFNSGNRYNARFEVRLRRLYFVGGFHRAVQESSLVPGGPRAVNSYYVSLSRWFNVF